MTHHNPNARLETFCDGVFAIAATLLIMEIKVPAFDNLNENNTLLDALIHHWPSWMAYILGFGTIFIGWVNTNSLFKLIDKTSHPFVFANGLLLLGVACFPFPTALVAEYIGTQYEHTGIMVYCLFSIFHNFTWILLFHSAIQPKNLASSPNTEKRLRTGRTMCIQGFILYTVICILAIWFPRFAMLLTILTWIVWLVLGIRYSENPEDEELAKV